MTVGELFGKVDGWMNGRAQRYLWKINAGFALSNMTVFATTHNWMRWLSLAIALVCTLSARRSFVAWHDYQVETAIEAMVANANNN